MGRKHNDVFVLGPESLDFDADFESGDETKAEPAARAGQSRAPRPVSVTAGSKPRRGLAHRPPPATPRSPARIRPRG